MDTYQKDLPLKQENQSFPYFYRWFQSHTLKPVLVDVTDSRHGEAEGGVHGTLQHHGGGVLKRPIFIHEDVDGSSLVFHAVKVKRGTHDEVIPTAWKI